MVTIVNNFFSCSTVWANRKLDLNGMEFIPVRVYFQLFITAARTTPILFKLLYYNLAQCLYNALITELLHDTAKLSHRDVNTQENASFTL